MKISLYIHIPFCVKKCLYCDFLSGSYDSKVRSLYVGALCNEIKERSLLHKGHEVISVFLGGGTPSVLSSEQIIQIMHTIRECFSLNKEAEITMEVNPGTVDRDKLEVIKEQGINRLSIGLQSACDDELKILGRIHTREKFEEVYYEALEVGFDNLNIDLISGIPGQSVEKFAGTLDYVLSLREKPKHISAYSLIIEEGTPFSHMYSDSDFDEETDRKIYEITNDILKKNGYRRYEISNYALDGYECVHNKIYWTRGEYLGLGIGAASFVNRERFKNIEDINDYIKHDGVADYIEKEVLTLEDEMAEFMFLGLRMMSGVSVSEFEKCFGHKMPDNYQRVIEKYVKSGHLIINDDRVMLTEKGIDISNLIFVDFM